MKKPQAVNFFIDSLKELDLLTDEQTGKLLKALLRYAENGEEPDFSDDKAIMLMFSMMSRRIDRDFERYSKVCEKRSEVGKKGGAPKGNANAARNLKQAKTTKTTQTETEAETETETDTDTETKADTETDTLCDARGAGEGRASSTRYILETSEIIDYLNQKAGSRYQPTAKSTERLIAALLNDGYTVEDMKRVVDMKCKEWKFTEYQKYLRPETLFGEKFEGYLNTPQAPTLPKRQSNSAWYDPSYAATIERYKNTSLFDD